MRKVIFIFKSGAKEEFLDTDNSDIENFSKEISKILKSQNVCLISSKDNSILLRPSDISGIKIIDEQINENVVQKEMEDVITD